MVDPRVQIIYEDDTIVLVNKPNDLIVHHSKFGGKLDEYSLCQLLNHNRTETIHPVHRLDRKTSGLILFLKRKDLIADLQLQFESQTVEKTYLALVRGHVLNDGIVDTPIRPEGKNDHKLALTHYQPIARTTVDIPVHPYPQSRYTLIKLSPKTGRMHQLRKHMNKISHPIIGDPKYGNRHHNHMFIDQFSVNHLFLHAVRLAFTHPITLKPMVFSAPVPSFWKTTLAPFQWAPNDVGFLL